VKSVKSTLMICLIKMIFCVEGLESMDVQKLFVFVCADLKVFQSVNYRDSDLIQSCLK